MLRKKTSHKNQVQELFSSPIANQFLVTTSMDDIDDKICKKVAMHSQASDNNVEHGGEGLAAVRDLPVDDDAGEPDEQRPRQEEHRVHGPEAEALGESAPLAVLVRRQQRLPVRPHRLLLADERLHRPHVPDHLRARTYGGVSARVLVQPADTCRAHVLAYVSKKKRASPIDLLGDLAGLDVGLADARHEADGDVGVEAAGDGDERDDAEGDQADLPHAREPDGEAG
jgi:hypothetical protein